MSRKEWGFVLLPLTIVFIIDIITKSWSITLLELEPHSFGPLHFIFHKNYGIILGLFSDLPDALRVVSLATGGAFLFYSYAIIQYVLPFKSITLRVGLSFLMGGIIGNVKDRVLWGYAIDFLSIGGESWKTPIFNLADVSQWIGYILIVYSLIRYKDLFWPKNDLRKNYWINKRYQLNYCANLIGAGLGFALVCGVFSYTYLRITLLEITGSSKMVMNAFLIPYTVTIMVLFVFFASCLFLIGKILSHRSAGPVYAFWKFCENLEKGKDPRPLKLRDRDDFRELEFISQRLMDIKKGKGDIEELTQELVLAESKALVESRASDESRVKPPDSNQDQEEEES